MENKIEWRTLAANSREWDYRHVLYAYVNPANDQILYIGLAWHRTIRQRFRDRDKSALSDFLFYEHGLENMKVLAGDLVMDGRLTRQLLSDVEVS